MLQQGIKAPEIILNDKDGNNVKLSDFKGKKVIVYFYSKDNTAGWNKQATAFTAAYDEFKNLGIEIIGISKDSEASHLKFAQKFELPFILLADPDKKALNDYDVLKEKNMYGKKVLGVVRTTYLIDENGIIEKVWEKVKPDTNATEILNYLKESM